MRSDFAAPVPPCFALLILLAGCGGGDAEGTTSDEGAVESPFAQVAMQDSTNRVLVIDGLSGPEAVKYDPDQDVYFISNFNGGGGDRDGNGYIARASAEGEIEEMQFMVGSDLAPFHAPRGMYIVGNSLWVADIDGVHSFDRITGEHLGFVDLTEFEPSFLNDVAATPDGTVFVTDTGARRIFRIADGVPTVAIEDLAGGSMNGITWDAMNGRMILGAWDEPEVLPAWVPGSPNLMEAGRSEVGGRYDGVEMLDDWIVVGSQRDNTIHIFVDGVGYPVISTPGSPADIAVDTRRRRVAVPYIALDRVDIWELPGM